MSQTLKCSMKRQQSNCNETPHGKKSTPNQMPYINLFSHVCFHFTTQLSLDRVTMRHSPCNLKRLAKVQFCFFHPKKNACLKVEDGPLRSIEMAEIQMGKCGCIARINGVIKL